MAICHCNYGFNKESILNNGLALWINKFNIVSIYNIQMWKRAIVEQTKIYCMLLTMLLSSWVYKVIELDLECPLKTHVLKGWSPAWCCWEVPGHWRTDLKGNWMTLVSPFPSLFLPVMLEMTSPCASSMMCCLTTGTKATDQVMVDGNFQKSEPT
jgi:hypothetical protein